MTHGDGNVAVTFEREAQAARESTHAATHARQASEAVWARAARLLVLVVAATLVVVGLIDSALAWKTRLVLSGCSARRGEGDGLNAPECKELRRHAVLDRIGGGGGEKLSDRRGLWPSRAASILKSRVSRECWYGRSRAMQAWRRSRSEFLRHERRRSLCEGGYDRS